MNRSISKYMSKQGKKGGKVSKRTLSSEQSKSMLEAKRAKRALPKQFAIGTVVRDIYTGKINTVSRVYWQNYAGGDTSDYTVEFVEGGWNKSTNLQEKRGRGWTQTIATNRDLSPEVADSVESVLSAKL